jgi:hypothetical protein
VGEASAYCSAGPPGTEHLPLEEVVFNQPFSLTYFAVMRAVSSTKSFLILGLGLVLLGGNPATAQATQPKKYEECQHIHHPDGRAQDSAVQKNLNRLKWSTTWMRGIGPFPVARVAGPTP